MFCGMWIDTRFKEDTRFQHKCTATVACQLQPATATPTLAHTHSPMLARPPHAHPPSPGRWLRRGQPHRPRARPGGQVRTSPAHGRARELISNMYFQTVFSPARLRAPRLASACRCRTPSSHCPGGSSWWIISDPTRTRISALVSQVSG